MSEFRMPRIYCLVAACLPSGLLAQTTLNWRDPDATSGNWSGAVNWWNGASAQAPAGNEILRFGNNHELTMTNDLSGTPANRYRIYFDAGATSSRTIGGSTLNTFYDFGTVRPAIQNDSTALHTLNFPMAVGPSYDLEINPVLGNLTIGGTISVPTGRKIQVWGNNGNTLTLGAAVSGAGGISIEENSTVVLSAANTYTGDTLVKAGTLNMTGSIAPTGKLVTSSGGTANWSGTGTIGGYLGAGDGSSGTVNMTAGSITVGNNVFIGSGAGGGTLNLSGGTLTANNGVLVGGGGYNGTVNNGAAVMTISGSALLTTDTTAGTFRIGSSTSGNTGGAGTLNLDGGALATNRSITGGTVAGSTFNFNGGTLRATGTSATLSGITAANVRNGGAVIDTNGFNITIGQTLQHSVIGGDNATDGGLTKKGAGALTLSGANSFTGSTTIQAGDVIPDHNSAFGTGTVSIGQAGSASRIQIANGRNIGNALAINAQSGTGGRGVLEVAAASSSATWSGPITILGAPGAGGTFYTVPTSTLTLAGGITGTGFSQRDGNVIYSGGGNYTSATITGTAKVGANNGMSTAAVVGLGASGNATLDLNGFNQTFDGVTRSANTTTITNTGAGASVLTLKAGTDRAYDGAISGGTGGLSLLKQGTSTLTLGGAGTYAGGTTISAGTLRLTNTSGAGTGAILIGNGTLSLYRSGATTTYANAVTSTVGTSGILTVDGSGSNAGTGTNSTYDLGTLTVNGTLTVSRPTGGTGHTIFTDLLAGGGTLVVNNTNGGTAPSSTAIGRAYFNNTGNTFNGAVQILNGGNFLNTATSPNYVSVDVAAGGYLSLVSPNTTTVGALTGAGSITKNTSTTTATLVVGNGNASGDFSGVIAQTLLGGDGTVALTKIGSGTQILSGANTYTGATTITAGTLQIGGAGTLNGGSYAAAIANSGVLRYSSSADQTLSGVISGAGVLLKDSGAGTLTLSGANTYTGKTTISAGGVSINSLKGVGAGASALGAPATVADGTIDLAGTLTYTGASASSDRVVNLTGDATIYSSGTGGLTLSGGVTGTGNLTIRGTQNIAMSGVIATGAGFVGRTDSGILTLSNPGNSFGGLLRVSNGTISANSVADSGTNSAIGAGSGIVLGQTGFNNTGTFQFTGAGGGSSNRAITIFSNSTTTNGGIIENTVAGQTLNLSGNVGLGGGSGSNPRLTLTGEGNGHLSGNVSGTGLQIIKAGAGTWTLSGTNSHTAGVTINDAAGVLRIQNASALGSGTITLLKNGTDTGTLELDLTGTNTIANTFAGFLSSSSLAGGGTANILNTAGVNKITSALTIANTGGNGMNFVSNGGSLELAGTLSSTVTSSGRILSLGGSATGLVSGNIIDGTGGQPLALAKVDGGTWTLTGANTYTGVTTISAGTLQIGGAGTLNGGSYAPAITNSGVLRYSSSATQTLSGAIGGAGSLVKDTGAGSLILTGANTFSGGTTVSAGTLQIGNGGTTGTLNSTGTLVNNAAVVFNRSDDVSYTAPITGSGTLTKRGAGALSLGNSLTTYSGGTVISAGTVNWNTSNAALGTGLVTLNDASTGSNGATLNRNSNGTLANNIVVANQGSGITTIGSAGNASVTYSGSLTLNKNVTLNAGDANGTTTFSGAISGTGGILKDGPGTVVISNNNSGFSGTVHIGSGALDRGVLLVSNSGALGSGVVSIFGQNTARGVLQLDGGINLPNNINIGNARNTFTFGGFAHLSNLSGNNTFSGNITITNGGGSGANVESLAGLLTLSGTLKNEAGTFARPFVLGGAGSGEVTGSIVNGASYATALYKQGTGTWTLSSANTYSGETQVVDGILRLGNDAGAGTSLIRMLGGALTSVGASPRAVANQVAVENDGSTLGDATDSGPLTLNGAVSLVGLINTDRLLNVNAPVTMAGPVSGTSLRGINKAGSSTLTLTGSGNWTGNTTVSGGTFLVSGGASIPSGGNLTAISGGVFRINTSGGVNTPQTSIQTGSTITLEAGTLRTNAITLGGTGSFVWSGGTLEVYSPVGLGSGSDVSAPGGAQVYQGRQIAVTGDLVTGANTVLDLGDLYSAGATVYNNIAITGSLTVGAGTELRSLDSPYLLRGSTGGAPADYGTLVLVEALGGIINPSNFTFVPPSPDGRSFSEFTGIWVSAGDPNQLPADTWYLETTPTQILFHYKVSAAIPEPGTAGLLIAGGLLLRIAARRRKHPHT